MTRTRLALAAAGFAVFLTACDQLFHVRTGTLVYHWGPQVADQTVIVPLTFFVASLSMLDLGRRAGRVPGSWTSAATSVGVVTGAYLASGLVDPTLAGAYAVLLLIGWVVRVRHRATTGVAVVGLLVAFGGVLGEAALSAIGEFSYAHPDLLGVPWWLFPLYLHGSLAAVDVVQRLRERPPSTGSMTPERNPAAGDSRKAAAVPNSSGVP